MPRKQEALDYVKDRLDQIDHPWVLDDVIHDSAYKFSKSHEEFRALLKYLRGVFF